ELAGRHNSLRSAPANDDNLMPKDFIGGVMISQARKLSNRICIAAVALVAAAVMNAQTTSGTIVGTVTDSSGGVVSGASITITNEGAGAVRRFDTGADGYYAATLLPGGIYSV